MRELLKTILYTFLTVSCYFFVKIGLEKEIVMLSVLPVFIGVLTFIMIFYHLSKFLKYLMIIAKQHSISWDFSRNEWVEFSKNEVRLRTIDSKKIFKKSLLAIPFLILVLILAYFANLLKGQNDVAEAMISPFVIKSTLGILVSIVLFLFIWYFVQSKIFYLESLLSVNPKVRAGKNYVVLNMEFYCWGDRHSHVIEKSLIENTSILIRYKKKTTIGGSNSDPSSFKEITIRIPIPSEKIEEAKTYLKLVD